MINTGNMKNRVAIYKNIQSTNEVGEIVNEKILFLNIRAEVQFDKTVESDSRYDSSWNNRLVVRTRYAQSMMDVITSRDGYTFEFQGKSYDLKNYDLWNQVQRYITFYIESDGNGQV